jgi:tetratricopeptide (TPR) repeat protein/cell division septation protein DedD
MKFGENLNPLKLNSLPFKKKKLNIMMFHKFLLTLAISIFCFTAAFTQSSLKRANKQYELSAFNLAVKSYQEVLEKNADHLEANSKIADCYRHLNQLERALPHYQAAIVQSGVEEIYVFQYGLTLQGLGRYDEAKKVFDRLAENSSAFKARAKQFSDACTFASSMDEPSLFKISHEFVNTVASDFGVALFKDEQIVFSSGRTDLLPRDSRNAPSNFEATNRLYISGRDKNGFIQTPVMLHSGFSVATNEAPIAYSPDYKWVAITKNNFLDGTRQIPSSGMELTLYIAQVDDNGSWSNEIAFPYNGTGYSTGYPAFSPDGNSLYFSSNRPEGYGGFDIYVSQRVGNTWSAPENLGSAVNSLGNEITPFHDGTSFYFASDYHKGFGGFDIFRAEQSNGRWSTIYHGGSGLNSSADDFGFVFDANKNIGYFVSNRAGGKGNEDIYRILKESDNVVVKVTDALSGTVVADATIDFSSCGNKSYQTNSSGIFNFQVMDNLDCYVKVSKAGYLPKSVKITSLGLRQNRTLDVALMKEDQVYKGKTVNGYNGYALEEVKIIATNTKTNEVVSTTADLQGDYYLALQPKSTYVLRFSKAGFRDVNLNFQTAENNKKTIQNVDLLPVGVATQVKQPESYEKETGAISSTSTTLTSGYSVQLAAVPGNKPDVSGHQSKVGSGYKVYFVREGNYAKIRVGVFSSKEDAQEALKKIKGQGYSGAWVVEEKNKEALDSNRPTTTTPKKAETSTTSQPAASSQLKGYLVRLATYTDMTNFDSSKIDDVGVITLIPKGKATIVLLSGYEDKASADIALRKARGRGFADAYIVMQVDGDLKRAD